MATAEQIKEMEAKLKLAKEQLKAKDAMIAARKRAAEGKVARKLETRKRVLLGAMTLAMMKSEPESGEKIMKRMDAFLTRDDERAVFGLAPKVRGNSNGGSTGAQQAQPSAETAQVASMA